LLFYTVYAIILATSVDKSFAPAREYLAATTQGVILTKIPLIAALAALAVASAVLASTASALPGPMRFGIDAQLANNKTVVVTLRVGSPALSLNHGGNVIVTPCSVGPQRLVLAHNTRHLANGESLRPYKYGPGWVYQFPAFKGNPHRPYVLKIPFKLLFNEGGSGFTFCVDALAVNFGSGQYIKKSVGFGVL
jgi:hypothetical protein